MTNEMGSQGSMHAARDGVFVNPGSRGKEPRLNVNAGGQGAGSGETNPANVVPLLPSDKPTEIRLGVVKHTETVDKDDSVLVLCSNRRRGVQQRPAFDAEYAAQFGQIEAEVTKRRWNQIEPDDLVLFVRGGSIGSQSDRGTNKPVTHSSVNFNWNVDRISATCGVASGAAT